MFRRPPPFQQHKKSHLSNVDDDGEDSDDDSSPTFLPFAKPAAVSGQRPEDPSATLRDTQIDQTRVRAGSGAAGTRTGRENIKQEKDAPEPSSKIKGKQPVAAAKMESSASSASSAPTPGDVAGQHKRLDALSPRRRAELARLSPRNRGKKGDGSDGTPSMGSSFSDLDGKLR
jgi:hypothetical protein